MSKESIKDKVLELSSGKIPDDLLSEIEPHLFRILSDIFNIKTLDITFARSVNYCKSISLFINTSVGLVILIFNKQKLNSEFSLSLTMMNKTKYEQFGYIPGTKLNIKFNDNFNIIEQKLVKEFCFYPNDNWSDSDYVDQATFGFTYTILDNEKIKKDFFCSDSFNSYSEDPVRFTKFTEHDQYFFLYFLHLYEKEKQYVKSVFDYLPETEDFYNNPYRFDELADLFYADFIEDKENFVNRLKLVEMSIV